MQELTFLKYAIQGGDINIDVLLLQDEVWLTQKSLAILFGVKVNTINYHIKRLKIKNKSTIRKIGIVQTEGSRKIERDVDFYNFDAVMRLGFQVNSENASNFRDWFVLASKRYLTKGFAVDDTVEMKKNTPQSGKIRSHPMSYLFNIARYFLTKVKEKLSTL